MNQQQILWFVYSFGLFVVGSFGHWYIMYWQFKEPNWIRSPYPYILAPIAAFFWILASHYGVKAFNGEMWSNRFLFFCHWNFGGGNIVSIPFWTTFYNENLCTVGIGMWDYVGVYLLEINKKRDPIFFLPKTVRHHC